MVHGRRAGLVERISMITLFGDLNVGDEFLDALYDLPFVKTGPNTARLHEAPFDEDEVPFDEGEEVDLVQRG
jgi:hypothetical protein